MLQLFSYVILIFLNEFGYISLEYLLLVRIFDCRNLKSKAIYFMEVVWTCADQEFHPEHGESWESWVIKILAKLTLGFGPLYPPLTLVCVCV